MIIDQAGNKLSKGDQVAISLGGPMVLGFVIELNEENNQILFGVPSPVLSNRPNAGVVKIFKNEATS